MKKSLLIAMACMLIGVTAKSQMYISMTNYISCDVDVSIAALDANCQPINNYGTQTFSTNGSWIVEETAPNVVEFLVRIVVDPAGSNIALPTITTTGACSGGIVNANHPTACNGGNVDAIVGGTSPAWTLDITP